MLRITLLPTGVARKPHQPVTVRVYLNIHPAAGATACRRPKSIHNTHERSPMSLSITLNLNGHPQTIPLDDPRVTLLDLLRERLGLTGTKKGCDRGQCGACTVLIDGRRINSCLALALSCDGAAVTTIEGLADGETLHPVQAAFIAHDGLQCGFCTPGQIMSAVGLIAEGHAGDDPERVRELMSGNICRCAAYQGITAAVLEATRLLAEGRREDAA
jgi:xanthine dehydrogenase YagT iron-sulfur-binding subunit